jgi:hypothetical protein
VGLVPAAEGDQRLRQVDAEVDAPPAGEADALCERQPLARNLGGLGVPPAELERVRDVRVRAHGSRVVSCARCDLEGLAEHCQALVDLAQISRRGAQRDECAGLASQVADRAGGLHAATGGLHRPRQVGRQHLRRSEQHEHLGQLGRRGLCGQQRRCLLQLRHPVAAAEPPQRVRAPGEQDRRAPRLGLPVHRRQRVVHQRERAALVPGCDRGVDGELHEAEPVHAGPLLGIGDLRPHLESALEMAFGVGRRVRAGGVARRVHGRGERQRQVVRGVGVMGERSGGGALAARERRVALEGVRVRAVQAGALAGQHVGVDRVAHQRVAERVTALVCDEQVVLDGVAQCVEQGLVLHPGHRREHRVRNAAPRRGHHAKHVLNRRVHPLHARKQHVGQRGREPVAVRAAARDPERLLHEERIALRALEDLVDERRVGWLAEDRLELLGDLRAREAGEIHPVHAPDALQRREEGAQRVPPVKLVGAVGADHQHRDAAHRPDEEGEQVDGRAVRPVQVLDDQRYRAVGGEPPDDAEHELEQPRGVGAVGGRGGRGVGVELRQQPGELAASRADDRVHLVRRRGANERAQDVHERRERQALAAQLDARPGEHPGAAIRRAARGLLHEARLADTGLAAHQDDRGLAAGRALGSPREHVELAAPPHQHRAHDHRHQQQHATT